jgi:hypothetical protein
MNMSNRTKAILITAILGSGVLVACGSSASAPGGSASIALAQAHATATAEVAQTATAMIVEANRRNEEALARMTAVASAGLQSTLTVQEQQINALAISQAKSNATQQVALFRATATAISVQKTAQADMYTATAVAVRQNQNDSETAARFWSYLGFFIILLLVFGGGGFLLLIGWRFVVRHSFIPNPTGAGGVIVDYSPFELLKPRAARTPGYQLLLPATASTPSAMPEYKPVVITQGRPHDRQTIVANKVVPSERELAWVEFKKAVEDFTIVVYEYAREKDTTSERVIPRWKTLAEFDPIRTYINARWWMDITDALVKVKVLLPKEPGKVTQTNLAVCKNLTDLVIMATRGQLLPTTPPDWFRVNDSKNAGNSDSLEQLEQSERPEQTVFTKEETDAAVNALPLANG